MAGVRDQRYDCRTRAALAFGLERGRDQERSPGNRTGGAGEKTNRHKVRRVVESPVETRLAASSPHRDGASPVSTQNVTRTPSCAANGIPTVVPGPKKSPKAPSGISSCFRLVRGTAVASVQLLTFAPVQILATLPLACWSGGTGSWLTLTAKFAPGLLRLKMLKNSANGLICQRSPILKGRVTRRSVWM